MAFEEIKIHIGGAEGFRYSELFIRSEKTVSRPSEI